MGSFSFAGAQKIDARAKTILDGVANNYRAKKNTYFKFTYGTGNGKVTKTEPGIFYSTPTQYKLKIMGTEQIFDGSKVYNVNDEDKEITIAKANASQSAFSPTSYLDAYKKDYTVAYIGKRQINNVNSDYIKMSPIKNNGLKVVNLYIDSAKKQIVKIEQFSTNNDVAVIAVKDYRENQNLDGSMFSDRKSVV